MPKPLFLNTTEVTQQQLIEQGIRLWNEEADARSTHIRADLWGLAEQLTPKSIDELIFADELTWADDYLPWILSGDIAPRHHSDDSPYPYAGLFISAFYFIEARIFNEKGLTDLAWRDLTQAYYYLGTNSSALTAHEATSKASRAKHDRNSENIRAIVQEVVKGIASEETKISINKVISRTLNEIKNRPEYLEELRKFYANTGLLADELESDQTLIDRFEDLLPKWARPRSPYQEICRSFDPFRRGTRRSRPLQD